MPIQVQWDNEDKTILRYQYEGAWTWDDLYTALAQGYEWIDTVDHTVDIIIDLRQSSIIPSSALTHARNLDKHRHPRIGLTIAVGANRFIQLLADTFKRLVPSVASQYTLLATLDEARALIARNRQQT
jgi:hypothetical protein